MSDLVSYAWTNSAWTRKLTSFKVTGEEDHDFFHVSLWFSIIGVMFCKVLKGTSGSKGGLFEFI